MKEKTTKHDSSEVRERAVRVLREHQNECPSEWAAIQAISAKFGHTAETLRHCDCRNGRRKASKTMALVKSGFSCGAKA
jgi:hypothetical protein